MTPLHCASMFDHPPLVEFLVNEGADVNALGSLNGISVNSQIYIDFIVHR